MSERAPERIPESVESIAQDFVNFFQGDQAQQCQQVIEAVGTGEPLSARQQFIADIIVSFAQGAGVPIPLLTRAIYRRITGREYQKPQQQTSAPPEQGVSAPSARAESPATEASRVVQQVDDALREELRAFSRSGSPQDRSDGLEGIMNSLGQVRDGVRFRPDQNRALFLLNERKDPFFTERISAPQGQENERDIEAYDAVTFAMDLVADSRLVHSNCTKPMGMTSDRREHDSYLFWSKDGWAEKEAYPYLRQITERFESETDERLLTLLDKIEGGAACKNQFIAIVDNPLQEGEKIIMCNYSCAHGAFAESEGRGFSSRYLFFVPSDSPLLPVLREGKNMRAFSHAIRLAIYALDPEKNKVFVDGKLGGFPGTPPHGFTVLDTEHSSVSYTPDRRVFSPQSRTWNCADPGVMLQVVQGLGLIRSTERSSARRTKIGFRRFAVD